MGPGAPPAWPPVVCRQRKNIDRLSRLLKGWCTWAYIHREHSLFPNYSLSNRVRLYNLFSLWPVAEETAPLLIVGTGRGPEVPLFRWSCAAWPRRWRCAIAPVTVDGLRCAEEMMLKRSCGKVHVLCLLYSVDNSASYKPLLLLFRFLLYWILLKKNIFERLSILKSLY